MTTALSSPTRRFVMEDVSWDYYDRTLHEIEASGRRMRITYDDGRMEYRVVGDEHERSNDRFGEIMIGQKSWAAHCAALCSFSLRNRWTAGLGSWRLSARSCSYILRCRSRYASTS